MFRRESYFSAFNLQNEKIVKTRLEKTGKKFLVKTELQEPKEASEKKPGVILVLNAELISHKKIYLPQKMNNRDVRAYIELNKSMLFNTLYNQISVDYYFFINKKISKNELHLYYIEKSLIQKIIDNLSLSQRSIHAIEIEYQSLYRLLKKIIPDNATSMLIFLNQKKLTLIIGNKQHCLLAKNFHLDDHDKNEELIDCCNFSINEVIKGGNGHAIDQTYFFGLSDESIKKGFQHEHYGAIISLHSELNNYFDFQNNPVDLIGLGSALRGLTWKI